MTRASSTRAQATAARKTATTLDSRSDGTDTSHPHPTLSLLEGAGTLIPSPPQGERARVRVLHFDDHPRFVNAGITSFANQRSWSENSRTCRPSAQWTMKSSRPGYLASIDLMPSITWDGGPQNHAFCWMPSASDGTRAGAPGVPHVLPCSSAYRTKPNGANHL